MIHRKIEDLIPYLSENFITYPLWEEGKYIPFVNFWQLTKNENEYKTLIEQLQKTFNKTGYVAEINEDIDVNYNRNQIVSISVFPDFKELEDGSYEFVKNDWSIEEMIDKIFVLTLPF